MRGLGRRGRFALLLLLLGHLIGDHARVEFGSRLTRAGTSNRFLEKLRIARERLNGLFAAGSGDVKQFPGHRVARNNHMVNRLALGTVRGNGVAIVELLVVFRQDAPILQMNEPLRIDLGDAGPLAVGCVQVAASVLLKEKLVAGGDFDFLLFKNRQRLRLFAGERDFASLIVVGNKLAVLNGHDFERLMALGVPVLPSLHLGRRRVIRRQSLFEWMLANEHGGEFGMIRSSPEVDTADA